MTDRPVFSMVKGASRILPTVDAGGGGFEMFGTLLLPNYPSPLFKKTLTNPKCYDTNMVLFDIVDIPSF